MNALQINTTVTKKQNVETPLEVMFVNVTCTTQEMEHFAQVYKEIKTSQLSKRNYHLYILPPAVRILKVARITNASTVDSIICVFCLFSYHVPFNCMLLLHNNLLY